MMKFIFYLAAIMAFSQSSLAQFTVTGLIRDKETGSPLPGASVVTENNFRATSSNEEGIFTINKLPAGNHTFRIRFVGYKEKMISFTLSRDTNLVIALEISPVLAEEVVISSLRARENSAVAYTNIDKQTLEKENTGRDMPYLLQQVPSLVVTSDAGTGIGYTGVRIRGTDASRINVTVNGIPMNDAESQNLYWVDMPDLASSVEDIQVQRGVGTSTNGAAAFGGSINIQTNNPSDEPFASSALAYGSFNTIKTNISFGSGYIGNKWNFDGRLSKITSDGYIDRATSNLKSFFFSGGYYGKKDNVKLRIFSGKEVTYQSWYGVPESSLDTNRTWNYYTYDNQVDDYQQDHYQLFYSHAFNRKLMFNTAFHLTYGRGFYEEFRPDDELASYMLDNVIIGNDTITTSDLIRRKWLDNYFYGTVWSLVYQPSLRKSFMLGGGYNEYDGDHFGEVIWSRYASNGFIRHRYYDDNGFKTDFNVFGKASMEIIRKLSFVADLQYRRVTYRFTGIDSLALLSEQNVSLDFINPKAGITYTFAPGQYGYFSFSVGNKEPSRDDYTESSVSSRPKHETLYDLECGYFHKTDKFHAGINYYLMLYDNQLVLTGEVNDVGNYTRTNIDKSTREGVEVELGWTPFSKLSLAGNATFSNNRILEFREYTDDYDNGGQVLQIYKNTDIAFSPSVIAMLNITGKILPGLELSMINRYVGDQFLDNTSSDNKKLDAYFTSDFRLTWTLRPKFMKEISLTGMINNAFNELYESNGYTFSYIYGGEKIHENYYYPQAGRNFLVQAAFKF